jgi:ferredoxin-NADP reductase
VSPYLVDELRVGDQFEVRGPIGGYFAWDAADERPLLLVGAGSGVVPLMAMLRHRAASGSDVPARMLYSSRSLDDVIYRTELDRLGGDRTGAEIVYTLTREPPTGWNGYSRRVDREMLAAVSWPPRAHPAIFVCGPTGFVETVASALVALGHEPASVKTERFGPTGG